MNHSSHFALKFCFETHACQIDSEHRMINSARSGPLTFERKQDSAVADNVDEKVMYVRCRAEKRPSPPAAQPAQGAELTGDPRARRKTSPSPSASRVVQATTQSLFPRLVLGWINADFRVQTRIFQHFSRSARQSYYRKQINLQKIAKFLRVLQSFENFGENL